MKRILIVLALLAVATLATMASLTRSTTAAGPLAPPAVKVDPLLVQFLNGGISTHTPVVVTYANQPGAGEFARLQQLGIRKAFVMQQLPMVICDMNLAQLTAVRSQSGVRSIWANRLMKTFTNAARPFIGVNAIAADQEITARNSHNPGIPVNGLGVGIGYIDTGIDATGQDLPFGTKVRQNVIQPLAQGVVSVGAVGLPVGLDIADLIAGTDGRPQFVQVPYIEGTPFSDMESGHGTFGAGVAAGLGVNSGGFYGGVARGAHLVGVNSGTDSGLPLIAIIGAYDYMLVHQYDYNIRVINNSWGGSLADSELDPANPINLATRITHDRNIVVVFAAGNAAAAPDAINPYSTMAWTISVAAGEKQGLGTPASFSSRGVNNGGHPDVAGMPADPSALPNLRPDITGSGVDIKSVRSHGAGLVNLAGSIPLFVGSNDLTTIAPANLPFYTTSQGTSFSCPQVSGVVALMLEANPLLTPDDVVTILRQTATPMPYEEKVVGSGYVDAHNAVRSVMSLPLVAHPADLFPHVTGGPQITDVSGDQIGSDAQDILSAQYSYDAVNNQIVYTMILKDLSTAPTNMQWFMSSNFQSPSDPAAPVTTLYISAGASATGTPTFEYGTIIVENGIRNQTTLGNADAGEIRGNQVIIRLSLDKVNTAAGYNVAGTTSPGTSAIAQILIGTDATGGLLLAADTASGSDFRIVP